MSVPAQSTIPAQRILVVMAHYGHSNDHHVAEILREYRSMRHSVHVVLLSNVPRDYGPDVEVIVGVPKNPLTLPFGHKKILAERIDDYDLFIYSEDDTPVRERTIDAFLRVSAVLRDDEVAGFIRTEIDPRGGVHFSSVHSHFRWVPGSVVVRGGHTFARFTNDHAAVFLLTREQLRRAIASGGFLVEAHEGTYDLMCSAATDPYTQCGFRRLVCISHLDEFITPHLPNKYLGVLGVPEADLERQLRRLEEIQDRPELHEPLLEVETRFPRARYSKDLYEHPRPELLEAVPAGTKSVLSLGCGWGVTEAALRERGIAVTAIPLDAVISAVAEAKGIEVIRGRLDAAPPELAGRTFDLLLVSHLLHLAPDPGRLLATYAPFVAPGGAILVLTPNFSFLRHLKGRIFGDYYYRELPGSDKAPMRFTDRAMVSRWLERAGFRVEAVRGAGTKHRWHGDRARGRLATALLASEAVILARRSGAPD